MIGNFHGLEEVNIHDMYPCNCPGCRKDVFERLEQDYEFETSSATNRLIQESFWVAVVWVIIAIAIHLTAN